MLAAARAVVPLPPVVIFPVPEMMPLSSVIPEVALRFSVYPLFSMALLTVNVPFPVWENPPLDPRVTGIAKELLDPLDVTDPVRSIAFPLRL